MPKKRTTEEMRVYQAARRARIREATGQVIADNPEKVTEHQAGKPTLGYLVGQTFKAMTDAGDAPRIDQDGAEIQSALREQLTMAVPPLTQEEARQQARAQQAQRDGWLKKLSKEKK